MNRKINWKRVTGAVLPFVAAACIMLGSALNVTAVEYQVRWGFGMKKTVASTNITRIVVDNYDTNQSSWCTYTLSVYNSGTGELHIARNCTTGQFASIKAYTNTIVIPSGLTYTFAPLNEKDKNTSVCLQPTAGSCTVYVAGH